MNHFYKTIPGWFNFQDIYLDMISRYETGHFVEIGTFMGKSSAFMGVEILNSGKRIIFDTIDTFEGSKRELNGKHKVYTKRNVYEVAKSWLHELPVNIIKSDSVIASKIYEKVDFVFIDGSHEYKDVKADIEAWLPKVKGFIGGHDYDQPEVKEAVNEFFNKDCSKGINSWLVQID